MNKVNYKKAESIKKSLAFGLLSIVMCMTYVMSILTPVPLVCLFAMKDKNAALSFIISLLAIFAISLFLLGNLYLFSLYIFFALIAGLFTWLFEKKFRPFKVFVYASGLTFLICSTLTVLSLRLNNISLTQEIQTSLDKVKEEILSNKAKILAEQGDEGRQIIDYFEDTKTTAVMLRNFFPALTFCLITLACWINIFLSLRLISFYNKKYPYKIRDLTQYRPPEVLIWPVILFFAIYLMTPYLPKFLSIVAQNGLLMMGVFYLIQGICIFVHFLDFLKIYGILRTLSIMMGFFLGYWLLIIIGFRDVWIDFRKRFYSKF